MKYARNAMSSAVTPARLTAFGLVACCALARADLACFAGAAVPFRGAGGFVVAALTAGLAGEAAFSVLVFLPIIFSVLEMLCPGKIPLPWQRKEERRENTVFRQRVNEEIHS